MAFPLARRQGLLIQELENETLIYTQVTHRAHCLNQTAAQVWRHCDGKTSVAELAQIVGGDEAVIETALDDLSQAGLLETCPPVRRLSRRALVAKLGAAMLLAPVVMSITAPKASAQTSPGPDGPPDGQTDDTTDVQTGDITDVQTGDITDVQTGDTTDTDAADVPT